MRWLLPPTAAGTFLRLFRVREQILGGDELHAVDTALALPVGTILITYQGQDHCIPLAAFYRLLLDLGLPVSEMVLRAPILAAGLAALVLLPLSVERILGRPAAAFFAWLLAISPFLVLYSRIVRSYAPVVLLGGVATAAFWEWLTQDRGGAGASPHTLAALFAGFSAAAVYFHLAAAPFVLSPLVYAGMEKLVAPRPAGRSWKALVGIGAVTGFALAMFMVPARETLHPLILRKAGKTSFHLDSLTGSLQILAGSANLLAVAAFWLLAVAGLALLLAKRRRLAAYTMTLVLLPSATLVILAPRSYERPEHIGRFLLIALPVVLLWVSAALGHRWRCGAWSRRAQRAAGVALVTVLAATGPFVEPEAWTSSLVHHRDFLAFNRPRATMERAMVPSFFVDLAQQEGDGAVLHYPWYHPWRLSTAPYVYQAIHRRPLLASPLEPFLSDRRLAWRNFVRPTPDGFLSSRAHDLVVHLDSAAEESRVDTHRKQLINAWWNDNAKWSRWRAAGPAMGQRLETLWGPPDFADESILVWNLERLRGDPCRRYDGDR